MKCSIIFILCITSTFAKCSTQGDSLVAAHVIFRHGDATPDERSLRYYPENPFVNQTYFPYGMGELTLEGKRKSYALGRSLGHRFDAFLGSMYYPGLIEAVTSEDHRMVMSLQVVLAGLFPAAEEWKVSPNSNWQPIIFDILKYNIDTFIIPTLLCREALEVFTNYDELDPTIKNLYKAIGQYSGINASSSFDVFQLHNVIKTQYDFGFPIPQWIRTFWPNVASKAAQQFYLDMIEQKVQYFAGNILRNIIEESKKPMNETAKLHLYSGKDYNIVSILGALENYKNLEIAYCAHIIIEVHRIHDVLGVMIFFQNYNFDYPTLINVPGCDSFCSIEDFEKAVSKYFPNAGCLFV